MDFGGKLGPTRLSRFRSGQQLSYIDFLHAEKADDTNIG
jgi:hypothetical protein